MFFGMLQFTYWGLLEPGFTSDARMSMTIFFTTLTVILVSLWFFISFTDPASSSGRVDPPKEKGVPKLGAHYIFAVVETIFRLCSPRRVLKFMFIL